MKFKIILLLMVAFNINTVFGQNTFKAVIKDSETKEPLIGATAILSGTTTGATADIDGLITLTNIPNGKQIIEFRYIGYETRKDTFEFPLATSDPIEIFLKSETDELDEIVVSSTRSSRTIKDIPTRIEFIAGEELEEKANMKAGDIRMLLSESTGIQTQQTSATSANASIRIQGLDGRYTQILKDGFPLICRSSKRTWTFANATA
jgi:outer membrane receptor for ferrienterochelin and colicins